MTRLVRSELLKVRSTKLVPILAAVGVGLVALSLVLTLFAAGNEDLAEQSGGIDVATRDGVRSVLGVAAGASQLVLVIGIVIVTTEFRHGTITTTFLGEPHRWRVLTAKGVASVLIGLAIALVCVGLTLAIGLPWLQALDATVRVGDVRTAVAGVLVTSAFWCLLGAALGALIRNQVAAIVIGLIGASIASSILFVVWPEVGRYLPAAAASAVVGDGGDDAISTAGGLALMAAYVVALGIPAFAVTSRRDVTG